MQLRTACFFLGCIIAFALLGLLLIYRPLCNAKWRKGMCRCMHECTPPYKFKSKFKMGTLRLSCTIDPPHPRHFVPYGFKWFKHICTVSVEIAQSFALIVNVQFLISAKAENLVLVYFDTNYCCMRFSRQNLLSTVLIQLVREVKD